MENSDSLDSGSPLIPSVEEIQDHNLSTVDVFDHMQEEFLGTADNLKNAILENNGELILIERDIDGGNERPRNDALQETNEPPMSANVHEDGSMHLEATNPIAKKETGTEYHLNMGNKDFIVKFWHQTRAVDVLIDSNTEKMKIFQIDNQRATYQHKNNGRTDHDFYIKFEEDDPKNAKFYQQRETGKTSKQKQSDITDDPNKVAEFLNTPEGFPLCLEEMQQLIAEIETKAAAKNDTKSDINNVLEN